MKEKDKLETEENNYYVEYKCRWCGKSVLEKDLDNHIKECPE